MSTEAANLLKADDAYSEIIKSSNFIKKQITDANAAGLVVRTWGIADSKAALKRAYESGAVGTTVDWPAKAREGIASL